MIKTNVSLLAFVLAVTVAPVCMAVLDRNAILYDRDGDIYIANIDGSNQEQLTSGAPIDYMPSISPEGTTIAFSRDYDLYLMDYDGTNQRLLVHKSDVSNNNVHNSDWTLDGEWIYFNAVSGCCSGGLYKVRPDGTDLTLVKSGYIHDIRIRGNFGDRVIFHQRRSSLSYSQNVRISDLDGSNEEQVTGGSQSESTATFGTCWSPDGQRFAYNYGHQHIYVANYPPPYNPVEIKTFGSWNSHSLEWLNDEALIWVDEQSQFRMHTINVDTLVEADLGINGQNPYVGKFAKPPCTGCNLTPWQLHGPESDMVIGVHGFGAAALDGYLYAVGGQSSTSSYGTNHVQRYRLETETWEMLAPLPTARHSLDCAVVDGYIYAIGGHVYNSRSENQRYYPSTNTWTSMASKPTAVSGPGIAVFNSKIYTFGGNRYGSMQSVIEVYDPGTNSWQNVGNMPAPGEPWRAATLGDKIYLAGGGFQGEATDHLWCYDPVSGTWDTDLPPMNVPRASHELVVVGDCLYAIGGSNSDGYLNSVEWWKPGETAWTLDESLNVVRGHLGAEAVGNTIYAFGGTQPGTGTLSSVESAGVSCATPVVDIDIKPQSCPNPLNVKSKGVLPVAILGSEDFDVMTIDVASIGLAGVAPIRSSYKDVAAPVRDRQEECECTTEGPDGYIDLTLKFKTQGIVATLGEVEHKDELLLTLEGELFEELGGTPIVGADCITIRGKYKPFNEGDLNKDGVVNSLDFAIIAENWLQSSVVED